jgi:mannose-6-phosphate isomerase-like protein (cupin superfamily)
MPRVAIRLTPSLLITLALGLSAAAPVRAQGAAVQPVPGEGGVIVIPGADTRAGFAKGTPLYEGPAYKVHASRREGPGGVEVHARDTDIFYILEGTATLVTGGRAVDAKASAPDELRGTRIEGGTARPLAKGDIVIVPNGVAHWFRDVTGPFLYYTVKVTGPAPTAP